MAKYIIDIPDEHEFDWVNKSSRLGFELCFPINETATNKNYYIPTGLKLESYTEPDREAIDDEVWEFVRCVHKMNGDDYHECFDIDDVSDEDCCSKYSYQEAKTQYDAWKKLKEEIHVGDEVEYCGDNCVVVYVGADEVYHVSDKHWSRYVVQGRQFLTRTGRHFSEVENLLERMREE